MSGYAADDPKHPAYAERMLDQADDERKRARERGERNESIEAMFARPGEPVCGHRQQYADWYVCGLPPHATGGHFYRREQ